MVEDAIGQGGQSLAPAGDATVLLAWVQDHVLPAMRLLGEQSFGATVGTVCVRRREEVIVVTNDTEYGLAAAVFGRNVIRTPSVTRCIESGTFHVIYPSR